MLMILYVNKLFCILDVDWIICISVFLLEFYDLIYYFNSCDEGV